MKDISTVGDTSDNKESRADVLTVAHAIAGLRQDAGSDDAAAVSIAATGLKPPAKRPLHAVDSVPDTNPMLHELKEPPRKKPSLQKGIPQDNPNQNLKNVDSSKFTSRANDQPVRPAVLGDTDVLSGRGGSVNSHPGNQRYWTILSRFREQYQSISSRDFDNKQHIANYVYQLVREGGTRFMKRDRKNGLVEEQSKEESLEKIKQGLRSSYTPTFLMEGKSEPDPIQTREVFQKEPDNGNTLNAPQKEKSPVPGTPKAYDSDNTMEETFKLRDEDVLVGQDSSLNNHPGNVDYLAEVKKHQQEYQALKEREKRSRIVMSVFTWVMIRNGRFLRQEADGEYQELSATEACDIIKKNLHDEKCSVSQEDDVALGTTELISKNKSDPGQRTSQQNFHTCGIAESSEIPQGSSSNHEQVFENRRNAAITGGVGSVSQKGTTEIAETRGIAEGSTVSSQQNATRQMTGTGSARLSSHQVARQPIQLNAVSEHTAMSDFVGEDDDSESFANGQESPEEIPEIAKDVSNKTVSELTRVGGFQTCGKLSTTPKQPQYQIPIGVGPGVGQHLTSQSQLQNGISQSLQPLYVSIHDDEVVPRLGDIPKDLPGQSGREWKTSFTFSGDMGSRVAHASTLASGFRTVDARVGPSASTNHPNYHNFNDNDPVTVSHLSLRSRNDFDVPRDEDNGAYSNRNTFQQTGYLPTNEKMPPIQDVPVPMFAPPRQSTREPQQLELKESDVLSGQGSGSANRPGNQRYLQKVRELQHEYWSLEERDLKGKTALAKEVYNFVTESGGRFVHKRFPLDLYVEEISEDKALKKIRRALRDGRPTGGKK